MNSQYYINKFIIDYFGGKDMYVVIDFETTGFDPSTCDIIEFAYAAFEDDGLFVKAERLYFYYKGMSWSEEAFGVHQIPLSFLEKHEDKFKENLIKMYSILNNNTVVGFNCKAFDCPFAVTWLRRQGIYGLCYHRIKDVMLSYKPVTKRARIKLTRLLDMVGITDAAISSFTEKWFGGDENGLRSHEASYDVTATALLTFMGVNKKLMTFAYADDKNYTADIDIDDAFGQSADVELVSKNCKLTINYVTKDAVTSSTAIPVDGLSSDVTLPIILNHVGTDTSTIYAYKDQLGNAVTFDTSNNILRFCANGAADVVKTASDVTNVVNVFER